MDFVNLEISESRDDRRKTDQRGIDQYWQGPANFAPMEDNSIFARGWYAPRFRGTKDCFL